MTEPSDRELLEEFARNGCEAAFTTLVQRYGGLVYSVALRHTVNPDHAQDISQAVFIILARKAHSLGRNTIIAGWLYHTARLASANFQRGEMRRVRREQEAFAETPCEPAEAESIWQELCPRLDGAMAELRAADRDALVLRYFKNKSMKEISAAMGWEERAAQKRVSRALEKLREIVARRGVTLNSGALAGAIAANSVHAAPAGLTGAVTASVAKGAATVSVMAIVTTTTKQTAWLAAAKLTLAGFFNVALSPVLTAASSYFITRAVMRRSSKSESERVINDRFGWKIIVTNVVMALAGIPSAVIRPNRHPRLFAVSLIAMVLVIIASVGLQIRWSFRHNDKLKRIRARQQQIQNK